MVKETGNNVGKYCIDIVLKKGEHVWTEEGITANPQAFYQGLSQAGIRLLKPSIITFGESPLKPAVPTQEQIEQVHRVRYEKAGKIDQFKLSGLSENTQTN